MSVIVVVTITTIIKKVLKYFYLASNCAKKGKAFVVRGGGGIKLPYVTVPIKISFTSLWN